MKADEASQLGISLASSTTLSIILGVVFDQDMSLEGQFMVSTSIHWTTLLKPNSDYLQ